MAGIGFVLRRLTTKDNLAGKVQAFTTAAAVTSGPWLLTVLAIAGSGLGSNVADAAGGDYQSFRVILSYDFCFSLVLAAPAATVASRLVADQLFLGAVDGIVPIFLATLAAALLLAVPLGALFWFGYATLAWPTAAAAMAGFVALVFLWITTAFLSVLREFGFVLGCYAVGMLLAGGGALFAGRALGAAGMLGCFALGIALIGLAGTGRLFARFPYGSVPLVKLIADARHNRSLALIGLLTAAAPWTDKWVMWFGAAGAELLPSGLRDAPVYDSAMFLAYLAMIPGSAAFFVIAETGFFVTYRRFFDEILNGSGLARIEARRQELCARVAGVGFSVLMLQNLTTLLAECAAPVLVQAGLIAATQFPILRIALLGVLFHLLLNCLMVVMSYLDLRLDQIVCASIFLILNAVLTAVLLPFGTALEGYGYFLAALATFLLAAAMVAMRCRDLIFIAFIRNNASIRNAT